MVSLHHEGHSEHSFQSPGEMYMKYEPQEQRKIKQVLTAFDSLLAEIPHVEVFRSPKLGYVFIDVSPTCDEPLWLIETADRLLDLLLMCVVSNIFLNPERALANGNHALIDDPLELRRNLTRIFDCVEDDRGYCYDAIDRCLAMCDEDN